MRWWKDPPLAAHVPRLSAFVLLVNVVIGSVLVQIEFMTMAITSTNVGGDLSLDPNKTFWSAKAFLLFMTLIIPPAMRLARTYGHKLLYTMGMGVAIIGSLLTLYSTTFAGQLVARGVSGMGLGIIFTLGAEIIEQNCPQRYRRITLLLFSNLSFGLGIGGGLIIGGILGQSTHWRAIFYFNLIAYPLMMFLTALIQPETARKHDPPFDKIGYGCSVVWVTAWLVMITNSKVDWNTYGWLSPMTVGTFGIGLAAMVIMIAHGRVAVNPLFTPRLFKVAGYSLATLGMVIVGFIVFGVLLISIGMLQEVFRYEQLRVGYIMSLIGFTYLFAGFLPGLFYRHVKLEWFILPGLGLIAFSCWMSQHITIQSGQWQIGTIFVVRASGIAIVLGPLTVLALRNVPDELKHKGSLVILYIRLIAATYGSSIMKTIVETRTPFHTLRFGEMVDRQSARFKQYTTELGQYLIERSLPPETAEQEAVGQVIARIIDQARLAALIDAIYILGWAVVGMMVVIGVLMYRIRKREKFIPLPPR